MTSLRTLCAAGALALAASGAHAALYDQPVASNAYIKMGGLDWAWGSAADFGSFQLDLSYQAQFGWRIPTLAELMNAPVAQDFLFAGANVPFGGSDPVSGSVFAYTDATLTGDAACAAAYFSNAAHCDWGNAPGTLNDPQPWQGQAGAPSYAEGLVVRAVPIPAAGLMLGSTIGLLGWFGRRRKAARV